MNVNNEMEIGIGTGKERSRVRGFSSVYLFIGIGVVALALVAFVGVKIYGSIKSNAESSAQEDRITAEDTKESTSSTPKSTADTGVKRTAPVFRVNDSESGPGEIQKPLVKETETKTDTDDDEDKDSVPDNNDSPDIDLSTDGVDDETLSADTPVYLMATVTDSTGGVASVEFYINDNKKATVKPRDLKAKSASGWDSEDADEAVTKATEYLEDKYDESNLTYTYRKYYNFDDNEDCEIDEGYLIIMLGQKNLYDVRVSEDLDDVDVCYKGKSLNYNSKYIYLFTDDADDYDFYVKAYDTYGAESKSEEISFELE